MIRKLLLVPLALGLAVAGLGVGAAAAPTPSTSSGAASVTAVSAGLAAMAARFHPRAPLRAQVAAPPHVDLGVYGPGTISYPDSVGEYAAVNLTNIAASVGSQTTVLTADKDGAAELPRFNPDRIDDGMIWGLDTNGDGAFDREVFLVTVDVGRTVGIVTNGGGQQLRCMADVHLETTYVEPELRGRYTASVPTACLGTLRSVAIAGEYQSRYVSTGGIIETRDDVPDDGFLTSTTSSVPQTATAGSAIVLDAAGALSWAGVDAPPGPPPSFQRAFFGIGPIRGFAMTPDGGNGAGVDGWGNFGGIGVGDNGGVFATPADAPAFGFDIARGLVFTSTGRDGYVLDGFGGLHHFSTLERVGAPAIGRAPYWPGWDIARGVALLPNRHGGFVLDGFGGLHFFTIGVGTAEPRIFGAPYWQGWDAARGVSLLPDGSGGWTIDLFGGRHFFSIGVRRSEPRFDATPYWPGRDVARGIAVLPVTRPAPEPAPTPTVLVPHADGVAVDHAGTYAYVAQPADAGNPGTLAVVSLTDRRIVATIPVGLQPDAVAISIDGREVYTANEGSRDVSIIDVATRRELRRIQVGATDGRGPSAVAAGAGHSIYVGVVSHSQLWRVDLDTDVKTQLPLVPQGADWPIVKSNADGTKVAIALFSTFKHTLSVYDATAGTMQSHVLPAVIPRDVAISGDGTRIVTGGWGDASGTADAYDGNGAFLGHLAPDLDGVAIDATGSAAYVVDSLYQVTQYDLATFEPLRQFQLWGYAHQQQKFMTPGIVTLSGDGKTLVTLAGDLLAINRVA